MLQLILCDKREELISAWREEFKPYPEVRIIQGDIFKQKADAIVSPGNSFGHMDAGMDKYVNDYFGWSLEERVKKEIKEKFYGELPVGNAFVLPMKDKRFTHFISSPTMRVPMQLKNSINVYLATRATFVVIKEYNHSHSRQIRDVIIPGMGVSTGKMPYEIAAKQMKIAYENIVLEKECYPENWEESVKMNKELK